MKLISVRITENYTETTKPSVAELSYQIFLNLRSPSRINTRSSKVFLQVFWQFRVWHTLNYIDLVTTDFTFSPHINISQKDKWSLLRTLTFSNVYEYFRMWLALNMIVLLRICLIFAITHWSRSTSRSVQVHRKWSFSIVFGRFSLFPRVFFGSIRVGFAEFDWET